MKYSEKNMKKLRWRPRRGSEVTQEIWWGNFEENSLVIARQVKVILFDTRAYVNNLVRMIGIHDISGNAKMMIERNDTLRDQMQTVTN